MTQAIHILMFVHTGIRQERADVCVVGHGLSGLSASTMLEDAGINVMSIGSGPESSSSYHMAGKVFLPDISSTEYQSAWQNLGLSARALQTTETMLGSLQASVGVPLVPLVSAPDPLQLSCANAPRRCCDTTFIEGLGIFSCKIYKKRYKASSCCKNGSSHFSDVPYWPAFDRDPILNSSVRVFTSTPEQHLCHNDYLDGAGILNALFGQLQKKIIAHVLSVSKADGQYILSLSRDDIPSVACTNLIFANGGFAGGLLRPELEQLGIQQREIFAINTTNILRETSHRFGWKLDPLDAWFVEFVNGSPAWTLHQDSATVLAESESGYMLVYDENSDFHTRSTIRNRRNISNALLLTVDTQSGSHLTTAMAQAIRSNEIAKTCDNRHKRSVHQERILCPSRKNSVSSECNTRVGENDSIMLNQLNNGILDTLGGPIVHKNTMRIYNESNVWSIGRAVYPVFGHNQLADGYLFGNDIVSASLAAANIITKMNANVLETMPPASPCVVAYIEIDIALPSCVTIPHVLSDAATIVAFIKRGGVISNNTNTVIAAFDDQKRYRGHGLVAMSPALPLLAQENQNREVHTIVIQGQAHMLISFKYWWLNEWHEVKETYRFVPLDTTHSSLLNAMTMSTAAQ
jgi:hypothetical protein